ncbi:MAG: putative sulfate exporter family transporter [Actinomycetota bacterium]|nr:putative sulfate exporter family transporter [Actinomycetota bacterium]
MSMPTPDRSTTSPPLPPTDASSSDAPASMPTSCLASLLPGLLLVVIITAAATVAGGRSPVVGAPVFAIIAGAVIAALRPRGGRLGPGITFCAGNVLKGSIVVLGLNLSLHQVVTTGMASLPVLVGTLVIALGAAWLIGRFLRLGSDVNTLIGVGTAICGASAIAATDAVIGAEETDVSYAIATIFTFNIAAVVAYPLLGHVMGLSQHAFGLWAGTAINDTSSVVAASTTYGGAAGAYGVIVKLTRTLAIIPICVALAAWRCHRAARPTGGAVRQATTDVDPAPTAQLSTFVVLRARVRRIVPMFIIAFVAAVIVNTVGAVPAGWHHGLGDVASWMITAALAGVGLSTRIRDIRAAGGRPLLLGGILWVTVGVTSLALQAASGSL